MSVPARREHNLYSQAVGAVLGRELVGFRAADAEADIGYCSLLQGIPKASKRGVTSEHLKPRGKRK